MQTVNAPFTVMVLQAGASLSTTADQTLEQLGNNTMAAFSVRTQKTIDPSTLKADDPDTQLIYKDSGGEVHFSRPLSFGEGSSIRAKRTTEAVMPTGKIKDIKGNTYNTLDEYIQKRLEDPTNSDYLLDASATTMVIPQVVVIRDFSAQCGTEYGVRVSLKNAETYAMSGYIPSSYLYTANTDCCKGCGDCEMLDPNTLAYSLYRTIKASKTAPVEVFLRKGVDRTILADTDIVSYIESVKNAAKPAEPTDTLYLELRSKPLTEIRGEGINPRYFKMRSTSLEVTLIEGFSCSGASVLHICPYTVSQGKGYDVRQLEYEAGGFENNPGVYRIREGAPYSIHYFADADTYYNQVVIEYQNEYPSGWGHYVSPARTYIAIPTTLSSEWDTLKQWVEKL